MWFDTILWLVAIVAFIMVEAATTALVSVWFAVGAPAGRRRGSIVALPRRHKGFIFSYPI